MQISTNFFKPSMNDKAKDDMYCKNNGIDNSNMDYNQTKGAIVSNMTNGELGAGFATNVGPLDRLKDLAKMESLGLEDQGSRDKNKTAILNWGYLA